MKEKEFFFKDKNNPNREGFLIDTENPITHREWLLIQWKDETRWHSLDELIPIQTLN